MLQSKLSSLAYEQILQNIVSFKPAPGTALQERSLAEQMNMSRTPVREALFRLTHEGWLQNSFRRNVMEVRPVSGRDVEELLNVRQLLETDGVKRIFENRANAPVGEALMDITAGMRAKRVAPGAHAMEYMALDMKFHTALMYLDEQSRLGLFWKPLCLESIRLGIMVIHCHHCEKSMVADIHEAIARGILRRRKKEVRDALHYHNERIRLQSFRMLEGMAAAGSPGY